MRESNGGEVMSEEKTIIVKETAKVVIDGEYCSPECEYFHDFSSHLHCTLSFEALSYDYSIDKFFRTKGCAEATRRGE